jgi:hypothetical protein
MYFSLFPQGYITRFISFLYINYAICVVFFVLPWGVFSVYFSLFSSAVYYEIYLVFIHKLCNLCRFFSVCLGVFAFTSMYFFPFFSRFISFLSINYAICVVFFSLCLRNFLSNFSLVFFFFPGYGRCYRSSRIRSDRNALVS